MIGRAAALLVALAAVLALSACGSGSGDEPAQPSTAPVATVRSAKCSDWRSAPETQRWQLVRGMRAFFGTQVDSPGERGEVLPDRSAYRIFDNYCHLPFARGFSLYRLYGNAAAFTRPG